LEFKTLKKQKRGQKAKGFRGNSLIGGFALKILWILIILRMLITGCGFEFWTHDSNLWGICQVMSASKKDRNIKQYNVTISKLIKLILDLNEEHQEHTNKIRDL
jgi:hypothetical protein